MKAVFSDVRKHLISTPLTCAPLGELRQPSKLNTQTLAYLCYSFIFKSKIL